MLSILIYCLVLAPLFYIYGSSFNLAISKFITKQKFTSNGIFLPSIIGLAIIGMLSNWMSLFIPLGKSPHLIITLYGLAILLVFFLYKNKKLYTNLNLNFSLFRISIFCAIAIIILIKSASPSELLDEGGYYLPFIKWIESYRVVPGIANLQGRLGFNSNWHVLSALFSFRWLNMTPFYDLNGLLAILFVGFCVFETKKTNWLQNYLGLFLCAFLFRNFLTSSASDLPNIYLSSTIILLLLESSDTKTKDNNLLFKILILTCFLITIKTSSIYLLLLLIPIFIYKTDHKYLIKNLISTITIGLIYATPWFIRHYITTGYIIFPLPGVDLFNPDWKVSAHSVLVEYNAVKYFAIHDQISSKILASLSIYEWFPLWFKHIYTIPKLFFTLTISSIGIYAFTIKHQFKKKYLFIINSILLLNIIIWLISYPDFRFAWGFLLPFVFINIAQSISLLKINTKYIHTCILLFTLGMTLLNAYKTYKESKPIISEILIKQKPFPQNEIKEVQINNFKANEGRPCWDAPLPSVLPWGNRNIEMRTNNIQDGFKQIKK